MKKMPSNHHWVKFYFKDWTSNINLQRCDVASRGLWMDLFCLMQASEQIGYLISQGKALTTGQIAKLVGLSKRRAEHLLKDLIDNGICAYEGEILYSPLLVDRNEYSGYVQNEIKITSDCTQFENEIPSNRIKNHNHIWYKNQSTVQDKDISLNISTAQDILCTQAHMLPKKWYPQESDRIYAQELGLDVQSVMHEFCNYWQERNDKGAMKTDWNVAWRAWCRRAVEWKKNKKNYSHKVISSHPLEGFINSHHQQWDE